MSPRPTRRLVLRLLAGAAALPAGARAQQPPLDQGIGGTGARAAPEPAERPPGEGDRGIGGTGVIGTIRRFGSIVVNGLRIAYPADVAVRIDGAPATAADLRIGQVVQVVARPGDGGLATRRIDVTSEVVGPVDAAAPGRLTVLGQRVMTGDLPGDWKPGIRVAVSGLRRPDGVIVASLIETRPAGPDRVAGPVSRDADGTLRIGALRLEGAAGLVPGKRALVTGEPAGNALRVTNAALAGLPFPPGLRQVSIEAYIGRAGRDLDLGSGLRIAGRPSPAVPRTGSVRAVVTARVAPGGDLTVERLRAEDRIAPQAPEPPRFERERDRLDLRGLPDGAPNRLGGEPGRFGIDPGGPPGGTGPRGPAIDTRPGGDIPGSAGPRGFGAPGGGEPGNPAGRPGGGPGGFGGIGPGFGGPGGGPAAGPGGGPGGPGGGFGGRR
ncbi:DUF5666 domain-containing protein [Methylobacterium sp. NEAU 140]|uniref:DUF5666 domain-containing protein n=1 Tax=Methylobacterium sp. NEAU 140 TaxID=3064945 RepID=UPI0027341AA2|nr:DUF5666 domain-containing protein [Methylobacterium sp. NEAU 140]MDP4025653.1 DUF5666 domain-containing protein [Methylobacterium sp. NEAU 140]